MLVAFGGYNGKYHNAVSVYKLPPQQSQAGAKQPATPSQQEQQLTQPQQQQQQQTQQQPEQPLQQQQGEVQRAQAAPLRQVCLNVMGVLCFEELDSADDGNGAYECA